ncbi:SDR family NAD(P)-dependent oxidoreductase [Rhodococcus aetherivorans]|uniref:SDR family NAD(P)-dependent oxidoreductase n=1 Tax=Rhodococcus aetherivorans TaxID=191292 RepID=UPI00364E4C2A
MSASTTIGSFASSAGLITGAAGHLGSAVARALVHAGARATIADLPSEALDALARELGPQVQAVGLDVTDESQVERAVQVALEFGGGKMDFVFNNAATEGPIGPITELDLTAFARVFAVNVTGAATVLKYALRVVGNGARIVQTGSTASIAGAPGMAPYVASKHALLGLSRVASREAAARGIRVTTLLPGPIDGPMMQRIAEGRAAARTTTGQPTALHGGRQARVDEIVSAALFLLGEESSFVAGAELLVDGGRNA